MQARISQSPSTRLEQIQVSLWWVFMFSLPLSKAINSICLVLLGLVSIVLVQKGEMKATFKKNLPVIGLGSAWFAYLLSVSWSEVRPIAWDIVYKQMPLIWLSLCLMTQEPFIRSRYRLLLTAFLSGICLAAVFTLFFYSLPEESAVQISDSLRFLGIKQYILLSKREAFGVYSPFIVRLQFSNLLAIALLTLIALYQNSWIKLLSGLLMGTCIILLGGRGGQAGWIVGMGILGIGSYHRFLQDRIASGIGKVLALILPYIAIPVGMTFFMYIVYLNVPAVTERYNQLIWELRLYESGEYLQYEYKHFTGLRRVVSWKNTWDLALANPFTGTGIGDYQYELEAIYSKQSPDIPVHSHHHFIFLVCNTGILGLMIFLGGILYWFIRNYPYMQSHWKMYALSLLFMWVTIMQFDIMNTQIDITAFVLFLGIAGIAGREDQVLSPGTP